MSSARSRRTCVCSYTLRRLAAHIAPSTGKEMSQLPPGAKEAQPPAPECQPAQMRLRQADAMRCVGHITTEHLTCMLHWYLQTPMRRFFRVCKNSASAALHVPSNNIQTGSPGSTTCTMASPTSQLPARQACGLPAPAGRRSAHACRQAPMQPRRATAVVTAVEAGAPAAQRV